jgi:hypothetical protein
MIRHNCYGVCDMYGHLRSEITHLQVLMKTVPGTKTTPLSSYVLKSISVFVLDSAEKVSAQMGMEMSLLTSVRLKTRIDSGEQYTAEAMCNELNGLLQANLMELHMLTSAYIPPSHREYFEQEKLFGEAVHQAFPKIRTEIRNAGNALAVDLCTAAVFHLMRTAEKGMQVLAWDRRVGNVHNKPLELQQWKDMLDGVEREVSKITSWPNSRGLAKTQAEEFYNGILAEFRGFKDAWRNHVMHSRRDYEFGKAKVVMSHVSRFMSTLAIRLSESKRTPRMWGKSQIISHGR